MVLDVCRETKVSAVYQAALWVPSTVMESGLAGAECRVESSCFSENLMSPFLGTCALGVREE